GAARGEMWRWFGNRSLRDDGGAQLFELRSRAARIWAREQGVPRVRPLERFAAGVNAYVGLCRAGQRPWPAELRRLGVEPEDWRPEDSVILLLAEGFVLDFELRSEEHTSELQSRFDLVCRLLLEKKKKTKTKQPSSNTKTSTIISLT